MTDETKAPELEADTDADAGAEPDQPARNGAEPLADADAPAGELTEAQLEALLFVAERPLSRSEIARLAEAPADGKLNPLALCRSIDGALDDDSVLVGDGGDFVATASYTVRPRGPLSWLDPGVFGTLGVGAGFALAAKLVRPDADVWLLWGDGAAGYSILELDTFVRHGLPIIGVIGKGRTIRYSIPLIIEGSLQRFRLDAGAFAGHFSFDVFLHPRLETLS